MTKSFHDEKLSQMEVSLSRCKRRLLYSQVGNRLGKACHTGLIGSVILAGVYIIARAMFALLSSSGPIAVSTAVLAAVVVVIAVVLVGIVRAAFDGPSIVSAAQRLDLSCRSHNRIATALNLLAGRAETSFALAAIEDGQEHLAKLRDELPQRYPFHFRIGRCAVLLVVTAVIFFASLLIHPLQAGDGNLHPDVIAQIPREIPNAAEQNDPESPANNANTSPKPPEATPKLAMATEPNPSDDSPARKGLPAAGLAGGSAKGKSKKSQAQSQSSSTSSGSKSGEQKDPGKKTPPSKTPRKPKQIRAIKPNKPNESEDASSISSGQSHSGGAMLPVQNDWEQKSRGNSRSMDDADDEEDVGEESEGSKQRSGVQPQLKDRRKAPSRELGMGGGGSKKKPGNGRGGPGQPKKSRGTASLILGIPLPDFVKGRLLPGRTKTTQEQTQPTPMPGKGPGEVTTTKRTLPENQHKRYFAPAEFAATINAYLDAMRSTNNDQ